MFIVTVACCIYAASAVRPTDKEDTALIQQKTVKDIGKSLVPSLTANHSSSHDLQDRAKADFFIASHRPGKSKQVQLTVGALAVFLSGLGGFGLMRQKMSTVPAQDSSLDGTQHQEVLGMFCVAIGATLGSIANAFNKLLSHRPLVQVVQVRFLLQSTCGLIIYTALSVYGLPIHILGRPGNRLLLVARAITFSGSLALLWASVTFIPLGETTAYVYLSPIICGLLAYAFLGEHLGYAFAAHAAVSFMGVFLVAGMFNSDSAQEASVTDMQDDNKDHVKGTLLALASSVLMATSNIFLRSLKGSVSSWNIQICQDVLSALVFVPCAQFVGQRNYLLDWSAWEFHDALLLGGFVASGMTGSLFVIMGFSLTPAVKAAPFTYCEVCAAFAIQICIFGQVPQSNQFVGVGLIVVAAAGRAMFELAQSQIADPQCEQAD